MARAGDSQSDELKRLREENQRLLKRLEEAQVNSQTDRQARRAALNLMEDAVQARAAQQRENAQRQRVEQELRDANRHRDEFLAMLAHELRNPLAPIRTSVEILKMDGSDVIAAEHARAMLDRQVNHMIRLVDDLMEVSRITRGQIELKMEHVEFAAVIRNAVEISTPLLDTAHHQFEVVLPLEPMFVEGDPVRLAQVFANLLNNAAKYTPHDGQISLVAERQGDDVVVAVRDNGIGISANMLPRVFDMFTQVDRSSQRSAGGLGIGLTLVQRLVELHGGSISATSGGVGQGSEFVVRLPAAPDAPSDRRGDRPTEETAICVSRRILIVDDNHDAALSLSILLRRLGLDVSTVHDGKSALAALESYQPEIVLLDIGMPEMDGYEVARRIRQTPAGKETLLIALTGWGQEEDRRRTKDAGFDHHLVKPIELRDLQAILGASTPNGPRRPH